MDNAKTQLIQTVKEWVRIDNEIRHLQKEISVRKKDRIKINTALMETMKSNDIDCFDLNDGQICYTKKNVKKPVTNKVLFDILTKYYNGDITQASTISNFIKENITRKISKNKSESID